MTDFLSRGREQEIRETHPGEWLAGPWTQRYVEADGDSPAHYEVLHHESKTVLATLPDWAGGIALFLADAHDAVPELLTEIKRLRADRDGFRDQRNAAFSTNEQLHARIEESGQARLHAENESRKLHHEIARLRTELVALKRPDVARSRSEVRESYEALIAQAREEKDFEGAFGVECQLAEAERGWRHEDAEAAS